MATNIQLICQTTLHHSNSSTTTVMEGINARTLPFRQQAVRRQRVRNRQCPPEQIIWVLWRPVVAFQALRPASPIPMSVRAGWKR